MCPIEVYGKLSELVVFLIASLRHWIDVATSEGQGNSSALDFNVEPRQDV